MDKRFLFLIADINFYVVRFESVKRVCNDMMFLIYVYLDGVCVKFCFSCTERSPLNKIKKECVFHVCNSIGFCFLLLLSVQCHYKFS